MAVGNPYRWPKGSANGKGGQFAPKDIGFIMLRPDGSGLKEEYASSVAGLYASNDEMGMTPCLLDRATGEYVRTFVGRITNAKLLKGKTSKNGWYVNWQDVFKQNVEVYAIYVEGSDDIEGLIAVRPDDNVKASEGVWACEAPHNNPQLTDTPKYGGIGGHFIAIGIQKSREYGFGGDFHAHARSKEVLEHHVEKYGAIPVQWPNSPYHFMIVDEAADVIEEKYDYEEK